MSKGMQQRIKTRWLERLCRVHKAIEIVEPWGILFVVCALLLSVAQFSWEYGDRVKERQFRAWELITTRAPGNSGKIEALEYLNSEDGLFCIDSLEGKLEWFYENKNIKCLISLKPRVPLVGIDLSRPSSDSENEMSLFSSGAYLVGIELPEANLIDANLSKADLREANLSSADLSRVGLSSADLSGADLSGADLTEANLSWANLREANLSGANLIDANLFGADLREASLSGAILSFANLKNVDLTATDMSNMKLYYVDLSRATNLQSSQFDQNTCGDSSTKLPEGL